MGEAQMIPDLSARQEEILSLIVRSYTDSPNPISSKYLVETYSLDFSSATVRNEMARLEELGYIAAPHTSAGRIPTTLGYRYFVKNLIPRNSLTTVETTHIAEKFEELPLLLEQWLLKVATILSRTTMTASLVTPPVTSNNQFKHIELIGVQGRMVLMVIVLHGGTVQQRMINLSDHVSQETLSEIAKQFNNLYADLTANEIRIKSTKLPILEREISDLMIEVMAKLDNHQANFVYRDGLSEIIDTFSDTEGAQQAVRIFEERAFLGVVLSEIVSPLMEENDVQVVIAGDGRWAEIDHLSMVISQYGIPGKMSGTLGVLGPKHINYHRAISAVRYVSGLMTNRVIKIYNLNPTSENLIEDLDGN